MKLLITDYSQQADLLDAVRRYHTLLQMLFESNCYKVIETSASQIYRFSVPPVQAQSGLPGMPPGATPASAQANIVCGKCQTPISVQAKFDPAAPDDDASVAWPADTSSSALPAEPNMIWGMLDERLRRRSADPW